MKMSDTVKKYLGLTSIVQGTIGAAVVGNEFIAVIATKKGLGTCRKK